MLFCFIIEPSISTLIIEYKSNAIYRLYNAIITPAQKNLTKNFMTTNKIQY